MPYIKHIFSLWNVFSRCCYLLDSIFFTFDRFKPIKVMRARIGYFAIFVLDDIAEGYGWGF